MIEPRLNLKYNGQVYLQNFEGTYMYLNSSGLLYLYYKDESLPVCCNKQFTQNPKFAADSACRQLGYTNAAFAEEISEKLIIFLTCT